MNRTGCRMGEWEVLRELDSSKTEGEQGDNSEYRDHSEQRDQRAARNFKPKRKP